MPSVQRTPAGNEICPSVSDVLNETPASFGPSQSFASRVQRYTHAAAPLSGSLPATEKLGQPHDQTPWIFVSAATCFAASVSSFTNSSHAARGCSP